MVGHVWLPLPNTKKYMSILASITSLPLPFIISTIDIIIVIHLRQETNITCTPPPSCHPIRLSSCAITPWLFGLDMFDAKAGHVGLSGPGYLKPPSARQDGKIAFGDACDEPAPA